MLVYVVTQLPGFISHLNSPFTNTRDVSSEAYHKESECYVGHCNMVMDTLPVPSVAFLGFLLCVFVNSVVSDQ